MPSILNLKFKGNKSFVAFSNLNDTESLTKTWKVCTKVASYLEQGQRLENLSWRLWHLQNLMVDTDNAKSTREFKKLSKCMGDKLDKEKGRNIEQLEAPDFKRNPSTDKIRQRAVEKERNREASQNAIPGTIKRMQFTFSVDQPISSTTSNAKKDSKPSAECKDRNERRHRANMPSTASEDMMADDEGSDKLSPLNQNKRKLQGSYGDFVPQQQPGSLHFPAIFSDGFGPSALLYATPTLSQGMNYGEGIGLNRANDVFSISRPTIEVPLDEILRGEHSTTDGSVDAYSPYRNSSPEGLPSDLESQLSQLSYPRDDDVVMSDHSSGTRESDNDNESNESSDEDSEDNFRKRINATPLSQAAKQMLAHTIAPSKVSSGYSNGASTPTGRPTLTVRTQATPTTRSSGPGATATSVNPAVLRSNGSSNSAPGGVKAECSNCGATHTPLWRRGLNDELNCNACGLYCKLHKRPRPKSMRNTHGEGRAQAAPRQESVDVMVATAQCYNCHTTATPLWRKDDEGKTVCNACGLYYKLHGSARPISMKSDVIRKRSRHDARRISAGVPETPSASPGVSRRASPTREVSPTLAPDSTTQMAYEFNEDHDFRASQSELMGALGQDCNNQLYNTHGVWTGSQFIFPGPYHPDFLTQSYTTPSDPLPFASVELADADLTTSPRTSKRRRMSVDSASEPPSSAVSYSSYNDGYSTSTSSATSHSQRSSMEFPFNSHPHYNILRGSSNAFWHPPMLPQDSPHFIHPPMLPPAEESPMDYLHPPMLPQDDDSLFSTYLHPPMTLPEDSNNNSMNSVQNNMPMFPGDSIYLGSGQVDKYDHIRNF